MPYLNIKKVEVMPQSPAASTMYIVKSPTTGYVDLYFTEANSGTVRKIVTVADVDNKIAAAGGSYESKLTFSNGLNRVANAITLTYGTSVNTVCAGNDARLSDARVANGGNAATATTLATPRTINGVSFNGSANITVTADAATLTGTALKSTITGSSLTSVGTLVSLGVTGAITQNSGLKVGYLEIPQRVTGTATLGLADSGKHVFTETSAQTWTIPSNASVPHPPGTALTFVNQSNGNCTIAIATDTMYLAGVGTTGSRTLAPFGMATALKTKTNTWIISGAGLT